jgi:serine/threonine protein kinase
MQNFNTLLTAGTTIKDRYVVEDVLGKGEFGTSYLVRDRRENQKLFALKDLINPAGKRRNRIPSEVVSLMRLNHPALPRVHQVLNDDMHVHSYILMDYIEGTSLEALQFEQPERRFSLPQVMTLMAPIMNALIYLHNQQPPIIHEHIKPSSIIVSKTGTGTMLVGFGFASQHDTVRYSSRGYLAPEQYSATRSVSPRIDIYALGAVFYTLLTGIVPPRGTQPIDTTRKQAAGFSRVGKSACACYTASYS